MQEPVMKDLLETIPQQGEVCWIGLRPSRRTEIEVVDSVEVVKGSGLLGDRFKGLLNQKREVTLIQQEHIDTVRSIMKIDNLNPAVLRRNIVVSGINLLSLKGKQFRVGNVLLEMTGLCHPCSRMEANLGEGGYNAMRGHGGITAKVLESGFIKLNDPVFLVR